MVEAVRSGRSQQQVAREFGQAIKTLGIPVGEVYSSKLNRAVETATLISGKPAMTVSELTDSSAGSASGMANPAGANAKIGAAIRGLVNAAPKAGTNNFVITHKTNIADAFGKPFGDVKDGEALVYKPDGSGTPTTYSLGEEHAGSASASGASAATPGDAATGQAAGGHSATGGSSGFAGRGRWLADCGR